MLLSRVCHVCMQDKIGPEGKKGKQGDAAAASSSAPPSKQAKETEAVCQAWQLSRVF